MDGERRPLAYLRVAVFTSSFDRMSITPLLLLMARDFDVTLPAITTIVTAYLVAYGLMQVVWGLVSDRLGRLRTVSTAMAIAGVASLATVLAPTLGMLAVARLAAGGAFAGVVPGALIWVGDRIPAGRRHGPLTDIMAATAFGTASSTLIAGVMGDLVGWRWVFAATAVPVLWMALTLARLPDHRPERLPSVRFWQPLVKALSHGWTWVVLLIAFAEGVLFLGVLNFLPTVLQEGGMSTSTSGLVTATYGVAVVLFAWMVKHLSAQLSILRLITLGALMGIGAYVALSLDQWVLGVVFGAALLAGAWAFMHSSMQHWATQVLPDARASVVSLFASFLFLGSSAGTATGSVFAGAGDYPAGFQWGLLGATALAACAIYARWRYREQ